MTAPSPADRHAWRTPADHREDGITVPGGCEGTRFYADRA